MAKVTCIFKSKKLTNMARSIFPELPFKKGLTINQLDSLCNKPSLKDVISFSKPLLIYLNFDIHTNGQWSDKGIDLKIRRI